MRDAQLSGDQDRVFAAAMDAALLYRELQSAGASTGQIVEEEVPGSEVGRGWRERYGSDERVWRLMFHLLSGTPDLPADGRRVPKPRSPMLDQHPSELAAQAEELEEQVEEAIRHIPHDAGFAASLRAEAEEYRGYTWSVERLAATLATHANEQRLPNAAALSGYAAAIRLCRERLSGALGEGAYPEGGDQ